MKWLLLFVGMMLGAAAAFALVIYVLVQRDAEQDEIVFSLRTYYDSTKLAGDGFITVSGTLSGDGIGYPNNTHVIWCELVKKECSVSSVEQIGKNQIGRIEVPRTYSITSWNAQQVVAISEAVGTNCNRVTVSIDRRSEVLLWVQEPINHTSPRCKDADTRTYKWTIEDAPAWKRMRVAK